VIKIDRAFVGELAHSRSDQQMIKAMVEIARYAGQRIVAEGIEDAATLDVLRRLGVDYGQGYYLRRPGPLGDRQPTLADDAAELYGSLAGAVS
jgi:EAL domain-containing protein (putative c-di-GMP-specific phosphodiesterase class I)